MFHDGTTPEVQSMNRSLYRITAYIQLAITLLMATGCASTQPFFLNESPDLQYYLNSATRIEYPDVDVESLAETTHAMRPLAIGNHDYQFWDLTLEECVSMALQNAKIFPTTSGNAEFRQNVAAQFTSANAEQFGSIYDVAIQQSTTQSIPLTVDGNGNRVLPRGVLRANQVGGVEDALAEFDAQASGFVNYSTTDRPRNTRQQSCIDPATSSHGFPSWTRPSRRRSASDSRPVAWQRCGNRSSTHATISLCGPTTTRRQQGGKRLDGTGRSPGAASVDAKSGHVGEPDPSRACQFE